MQHYDIEVLNGADKVALEEDVVVPDDNALWSRIARIARRFNQPGQLIRVTSATGKIVVLVGVATAIRLCADAFGGIPPI